MAGNQHILPNYDCRFLELGTPHTVKVCSPIHSEFTRNQITRGITANRYEPTPSERKPKKDKDYNDRNLLTGE